MIITVRTDTERVIDADNMATISVRQDGERVWIDQNEGRILVPLEAIPALIEAMQSAKKEAEE